MGTITQALAKAAGEFGVEIRTGVGVSEILAEEEPGREGDHVPGRVVGVALESGEVIRARVVASGAHPKATFSRVPSHFLPSSFRESLERYRTLGASLKVHLALGELPDFEAIPGEGPQHRGLIVLCPSPGYIETAWDDAKNGDFSREPMIEACLHSVLDKTAAPQGKHVMSCFVQYGARHLRGGSWAELKATVAERVIGILGRYAPNLPGSVEASHVYTPEDLETEFGLLGGNIYQGAMTPEQLFSFRPAAGFSSYRTPLSRLYLCGSGAHPGGGVWGQAGLNAAREILRDLG
jgi:phytoene dehydrogenase-like protein